MVEFSRSINQPIELSQQAFSKFETGKGKSVPRWVALFDQACEFEGLSPEQRIKALQQRRGFFRPTLPIEDRMQMVELMVALPGETTLTDMFDTMLHSMPGVERDELPRELAKLLPVALQHLRFSIFEMMLKSDDDQASPTPPDEAPRTRQAKRT